MPRTFLNHTIRSWRRFLLVIILDLFLYNIALLFCIYLLKNFTLPAFEFKALLVHALMGNFLFIFFSFLFHVPFEIWEFTSVKETLTLFWLVFIPKTILLPVYYSLYHSLPFSFSLYFFSLCVTVPLLLAPRILFRLWIESRKKKDHLESDSVKYQKEKHVIIVGAGSAGEKILREIEAHPEMRYKVIGFVDDDPSKHSSTLRGNRVFGPIKDLKKLIDVFHIDEVLIAIPSEGGEFTRHILSNLSNTNVKVKTLPGIWEMVNGTVNISSIRNIRVEDLLDRDPIKTDINQIAGYLKDKIILITGAGGSIGAELTRQIIRFEPKQILLLGRGENRIFSIDREIKDRFKFTKVIPIIGDIRDTEKMRSIIHTYKPEIIFHAAAHKHVPLMELNPDEVVTNNILATKNLLDIALEGNVKLFINISTDKAVNPINVMGASKRVVELLTQAYNKKNGMRCASVRFGNVLGSTGSVVEVFQKQLEENRIIKVTNADMERYFMLIPEAVELVLQAGAMAEGNELFVLKMGKQVNILEFAKGFIKLSGLELNKDAKIEITGNRGNEKLSEELWYPGTVVEETANPWILKISRKNPDIDILQRITDSPLTKTELRQFAPETIKQEIFNLLKGDPT